MPSDSESSEDDCYGPALPPGFKAPAPAAVSKGGQSSSSNQIGPSLPPELRARLEANASTGDQKVEEETLHEDKSEEDDSDSDSDVIGPLPPDDPRALRRSSGPSSSTTSSKEKKLEREEWMLVPPKNRIIPGLGLGPRKFLTRTPQDSKKSSDEEDEEEIFAREADAEIERKLIADYDSKMDDMKKDFEAKKRRNESLLEIHQKDMKKKKAESSGKAERKPFDRDTDLKISGMSGEDKQKYIEKSKELNTKFSRGSRKYL